MTRDYKRMGQLGSRAMLKRATPEELSLRGKLARRARAGSYDLPPGYLEWPTRPKEDRLRRDWARRVWRVYHVTGEDVALLFERQKGRCGLCGESLRDALFIDHDHVTNRVRGLLHDPCNWILGSIEKRFSLARIAAYLEAK